MRRLICGAIGLAALAAAPAIAQQQCASQSDQSTFELQALRSELMVLATGCHDNEQYNAFIRRYQTALQSNDQAVGAYFKKRYGRNGQLEHDRFVTELANILSTEGSRLGSEFCPRNGLIFNEVLALRGAQDLPDYAAGKDLVPHVLAVCEAPAPAVAPAKKATIRTAKK